MLHVFGVGDNVVDMYVHTKMMYPGGNALNFSVYASQLGARSSYLGVFGSDRAAAHIISVMREMGIDVSRCRHHQGENGYAMVDVVEGDRVFVGGNKGGVQRHYPIRLDSEDLAWLAGADLVHSSCYSGTEEEIGKIAALGVPVSYDFSADWNDAYLRKLCPYVTCSFLSCSHLSDEAVKEVLEAVNRYGSRLCLATMGTRGAVFYDGTSFYRQAPQLVTATDTLGAGDSFFTAFILNYLAGRKGGAAASDFGLITESLKKGAAFAAKTCLVDGAFGHGVPF
ncbi:PfkB family carbohydrate kinase [Brevibacillus sp. B_LB10_24]|uniref:PfkB family carbohydrate kinase n=1 Tax=Brevibacillus sp. B_LB10_24 TaxID=3380645 RepID=UPI0038BD1891